MPKNDKQVTREMDYVILYTTLHVLLRYDLISLDNTYPSSYLDVV